MRTSPQIRKAAGGIALCALLATALLYLGNSHETVAKASALPEILSALPAGAPTLMYLDFAAVRASSFYQHRPDKSPLAVPNSDYADFVRSTGFDFEKDLDRLVVAVWPTDAAKTQPRTFAVAEGRFDRAKIRNYAASKGKVEQLQGREVYRFSESGPPSSLTFLDDHRVGLVSGASISALLDAHSDPSAADPARERAARVDGAAAFIILRPPPIPDGAVPGGPGSAATSQFASLARSVQWITLAARPEGDNLRLSLEGECDNASDARQIESMLEVARMFGRAGLESPKNKESMDPATLQQLESLLGSADVTQSGERVRILLELTPDIFKLSTPRTPNARSPKPQPE